MQNAEITRQQDYRLRDYGMRMGKRRNAETAALDCDAPEPQTSLMTLLQQMEAERLQNRERLRLEMRRELQATLGELVPARKVIDYGTNAEKLKYETERRTTPANQDIRGDDYQVLSGVYGGETEQ